MAARFTLEYNSERRQLLIHNKEKKESRLICTAANNLIGSRLVYALTKIPDLHKHLWSEAGVPVKDAQPGPDVEQRSADSPSKG
jgi:hypothetical protein